MYFELKENRSHGTPENPFSQYHISDVKRAFQIPVHWHDELEIIYVKQGRLHVTISGENYIGAQRMHLWYLRAVCISWARRQEMQIITHFCFLLNISHFRRTISWKNQFYPLSNEADL